MDTSSQLVSSIGFGIILTLPVLSQLSHLFEIDPGADVSKAD
jgi:hypothetical protein